MATRLEDLRTYIGWNDPDSPDGRRSSSYRPATTAELMEVLKAEDYIVIGRDENGKPEISEAALDAADRVFRLAGYKNLGLAILMEKAIYAFIDALASVQEATK